MPNVDRHTPSDRQTPSDPHGQSGHPSQSDLAVGSIIGQSFRVEEKLGSGGMGTVYRCTDLLVGRQVAVKLLQFHGHPDAKQLQRFRQEAAAIGRLKHANIVSVHQMSISGDVPFIVMEYIKGISLAQYLKGRGYLDPTSAIGVMVQVADALEHAHQCGVVHRDLKPSNIMLVNGSLKDVKILDFGIAKTTESESTSEHQLLLTQTGDIVGTPMYMSPEQILSKTIDGRSDQYSFGCVLYECLTGAPPFIADSAFAVMTMHTSENPLPLSQASMGQKFPPDLAACVERMLRKSPEERFPTMAEVILTIQGGAMPALHTKEPSKVKFSSPLSLAIGLTLLMVCVCVYTMFGDLKWAQPPVVTPHELKNESPAMSSPFPPDEAEHREVLAHFKRYLRSVANSGIVYAGEGEWWDGLKNENLELLHTVPRLRSLGLSKAHEISDEGMKIVETQANSYKLPLQRVDIADTMVDGQGLKYIGRIPTVQEIVLMRLKIKDEDLSYLKDLKLKVIDLSHCRLLTGDVVEQFPQWKSTLAYINLDDINCSGHLDPLKQCEILTEISLNHSNLDVSDMQALSRVPKLRTISLSNNPKLASPEGARMILSLPNLTTASADAALENLIAKERTTMLRLQKLTPSEANRIQNINLIRLVQ